MLQANIETSKRIYLNNERLKILVLYLLLIAGGLWHALNVFQPLMQLLAGPFIIVLSLWVTAESHAAVFRRNGTAGVHHLNISRRLVQSKNFLTWSVLVAVFSFGIEWAGVKTGVIFGEYIYGETLLPQLFGVPVAIGFAWLCMLLCTVAVLQRAIPRFANMNIVLASSAIAVVMVLFDFVMEPAAMALGYWNWAGNTVPYQNYLGWFVISFLFSLFGLKMRLFQEKLPPLAVHAFFAQLIYFAMAG
jgi:putative membrane protein